MFSKIKIEQGALTLILKGEVSVQRTSSSLLVRNQQFQEKLGFFIHFQNNLILTNKYEEVIHTDFPPSLKMRVPWMFDLNILVCKR